MATIKVNKKNKSYMNKVTAKSANNTYIPYESALEATTCIDFDLSASYKDLFAKSGNDLIILSIFNEQGKAVTNTIKDYFKYAPKYAFVVITQTGDYLDIIDNNTTSYYDYITKNLITQNTTNGIISDVSYTDPEYFVGGAKSDSYYISQYKTYDYVNSYGGDDYIYDVAGNDNYSIFAAQSNRQHFAEIHDFQGNDNYSFGTSTYAKVYDNKGNDKYVSSSSKVEITDLAGKDNYSLLRNTAYNIIDNAGDDKYLIYDAGENGSSITDEKGNDKYELIKANYGTITDKNGNDTYKLELANNIKIIEESGKDKYTITASDNINVEDSLGKDKYAISASDTIDLKDYDGKDNYVVTSTKNINITDGKENETKSGNDTYNLSYISAKEDGNVQTYNTIDDYAGAEKYNLSYCDYFKINDYNGNDKYILSDSTQSNITDEKGSDSYTIKNTSSTIIDNGEAEYAGKKLNKKLANDKYTAINSSVDITDAAGDDIYKYTNSYGTITDNGGNDKYTISASNELFSLITITDKTASNDIYNIDNMFGATINDEGGNDKYTLKNSYAEITDMYSSNDTYNLVNTMTTITDNGGKDTYTISGGTAIITDNGSSNGDTYNIKSLNSKVTITDVLGTGDTLNISGSNKNNLVFMADYNTFSNSTNDVWSASLFIFDKTKTGYTEIKNFFSLNPNDSSVVVPSNNNGGGGYIENIYAGKTKLNNLIYNYTNSASFAELGQQVQGWKSELPSSSAYKSISQLFSDTQYADDQAKFIELVSANC